MVVFLAGRWNLQVRQLHRRIKNRFQTDDRFDTVQLRVAGPREPGPYRVVCQVDVPRFLDDPSYPVRTARIEAGFQLRTGGDHECYWFNWVEPSREFLLGWHRDEDHPDLGPTHLQVNCGTTAVDREPARGIDGHPMAVIEARLRQLPATLARVEWVDGTATGLE